jgi:hypothetical protein
MSKPPIHMPNINDLLLPGEMPIAVSKKQPNLP